MILQNTMLGFIAEFCTAVLTTTTQEPLHTCMEQLGTCYDTQHRPDTAADPPTPPNAQCIETVATTGVQYMSIKHVHRFDVRCCNLSLMKKSSIHV